MGKRGIMAGRMDLVLDVLDEGLRRYRRDFLTFAALSAIGAAPLALLFLLGIAVSALLSPVFGVLMNLLAAVIGLPAFFYGIGAISRAALVSESGERPRLGAALAMSPLRVLGVGCYGTVLTLLLNMLASIVSLCIICPLYLSTLGPIGSLAGLAGDNPFATAFGAAFGVLSLIGFMVVYVISLALGSASYCGAIFGLQPLLHEGVDGGASIQSSIDLMIYRFGNNLLAWILASLVFGAISLAVTLAIGLLLPLPLLLTLGADSPITQLAGGVAWLFGLVLAAPPLPIWMALLYQRRNEERNGGDLPARIAALQPEFGMQNAEA
ncbi:MAG: hypothetical protein HC822_25540 [Oscillochloris sp.]|nr:hypothetical protein [Oscillochloris sp.]